MQLVWIPFILWQKRWFETEEPWKIWKLICKAPNSDESGTKCWSAGLVYLKSAAILSNVGNLTIFFIIYKIFEWTPQKPNTILNGSAESNHKLRNILSKYQFAIILKSKVAINNNIQNCVSLRPWIKYSSIALDHAQSL